MDGRPTARTRNVGRRAWLGCALVALACQAGLTFTVTFEEVGGLEAGDPVVYRDREIGRVVEVAFTRSGPIEVELEIDREHRHAVYREAQFTLERTVTGGHRIAVYDAAGPRTPIQGGEVVAGRRAPLGELLGKVRDLGHDLVTEGAERLNEQLDAWRERLRESETPEATDEEIDLLDRLGDYADRVAEMSREELERFREEELPELERRAAEVREWLAEQGRNADAERFWRDFRKWVESFGEEPAGERQESGTEPSDTERR